MDSSGYFKALEAQQAAQIAPAAGTQTASNDAKGFFGPDGASFRDVLDAVNPLNQIPGVSEALESETGHKVSTAAKLAGGALLGGPIGFMASLVDAVFEEATGKSVVGNVYAALTGDSSNDAVQVASNDDSTKAEETQIANNDLAAPVDAVEVADQAQAAVTKAKTDISNIAPAPVQVADISGDQNARDQAVLALYGNSPTSAHSSYKKAQMLPYLRDVSTSHVL